MAANRPSGCFVAIIASFAGFFALLAGLGKVAADHSEMTVTLVGITLLGLLTLAVWRLIQQQRLYQYRTAAAALAHQPDASMSDARSVLDLRDRVARLPKSIEPEFEKLYRETVSDVVSDYRVQKAERARLDVVRKGLSLPDEAAQRAEVGGFLEAHAALVADGHLTEEEEGLLTDLREMLKVPAEAIQAQLARTDELREARQIRTGELVPCDSSLRLKKGESCYHSTGFVEKKARVSRSYQVDGVRHREKVLADDRSGTLYVTNERILLVAQGTTTIKLDAIVDATISPNENILVLTVDRRATPYYLAMERPFVAAAYLERAANARG
jgi:hypothetical protein